MFSIRKAIIRSAVNHLNGKTTLCASSSTSQLVTSVGRSFYSANIDDLVSSKSPSIVWNADALHGLTKEQIEFRQSVRAFAEKELPEELVKKVCSDTSTVYFIHSNIIHLLD